MQQQQQQQHLSSQTFQQGPKLPPQPVQGVRQAAAVQERQQQLRRQAATLVLQLQY